MFYLSSLECQEGEGGFQIERSTNSLEDASSRPHLPWQTAGMNLAENLPLLSHSFFKRNSPVFQVRMGEFMIMTVLFWMGSGWGKGEGNDQNILCGNSASQIHNTSVRGAGEAGALVGIW